MSTPASESPPAAPRELGHFAIGVQLRSYFSLHHFLCADYWVRQSKAVEDAFLREDEPWQWSTQRAYVMATVFSSVAFLDAAINEVFQDVLDRDQRYVGKLSRRSRALMEMLWTSGRISKTGVLEKYDAAWLAIKRQPMDHNTRHYEKARLALVLRNRLIHFVPQTLGTQLPPHKIELMLKKEFPGSSMIQGKINPYWPDHCLGHGCAVWARDSCRGFADFFFNRIGLKVNYLEYFARKKKKKTKK